MSDIITWLQYHSEHHSWVFIKHAFYLHYYEGYRLNRYKRKNELNWWKKEIDLWNGGKQADTKGQRRSSGCALIDVKSQGGEYHPGKGVAGGKCQELSASWEVTDTRCDRELGTQGCVLRHQRRLEMLGRLWSGFRFNYKKGQIIRRF